MLTHSLEDLGEDSSGQLVPCRDDCGRCCCCAPAWPAACTFASCCWLRWRQLATLPLLPAGTGGDYWTVSNAWVVGQKVKMKDLWHFKGKITDGCVADD